jgi:hypothetical protein
MRGVRIHMGYGRRLPGGTGRGYGCGCRSHSRCGMSGQGGGSTGRHTSLSLHPSAQRYEGDARALVVRAVLLKQGQYLLRMGSSGEGQRVVLG